MGNAPKRSDATADTEEVEVFVKSFRHWKTKKIIHASQFGRKAFRLRIKVPRSKAVNE
jgi:hypothetical protein